MIYTQRQSTFYQAHWPEQLVSRFVEKGEGSDRIIANFKNHTKPSTRVVPYHLQKLVIGPAAPLKASDIEATRQWHLTRTPFMSESITVITPDELCLKGILIHGWQAPHKAIIFCNPRGASMEQMGNIYLDIAIQAGCTGVIFNQRGVNESQGEMSPNGYVLDAYSVFEYLVNRGMNPNDIIIYGRSMGSGWGAEAAAMVQKKYPEAKINFISDRSFSSLTKEAQHLTVFGLPGLSSLVKGLLYLGNAQVFNALAAVETLKGRVCVVYHKKDEVIPYPASLNTSIELGNCACSELMRIELKNDDTRITDKVNHNRTFTEAEGKALQRAIQRMLGLPESDSAKKLHIEFRR